MQTLGLVIPELGVSTTSSTPGGMRPNFLVPFTGGAVDTGGSIAYEAPTPLSSVRIRPTRTQSLTVRLVDETLTTPVPSGNDDLALYFTLRLDQ